MEEPVTATDDGGVWVLVAKGNLAHRIEKLGIEQSDSDELTDAQSCLRKVAKAQPFHGQLGRPTWAKGAFVLVTGAHVASIEATLEEWMTNNGEELMSNHIIVSGMMKEAHDEALRIEPPESIVEREAFQIRRCGEIAEQERIAIPPKRKR